MRLISSNYFIIADTIETKRVVLGSVGVNNLTMNTSYKKLKARPTLHIASVIGRAI